MLQPQRLHKIDIKLLVEVLQGLCLNPTGDVICELGSSFFSKTNIIMKKSFFQI